MLSKSSNLRRSCWGAPSPDSFKTRLRSFRFGQPARGRSDFSFSCPWGLWTCPQKGMLAQRQDHGDLSAGKFSIYFFPTTTGENKRASDAGCKPFSMHVGQSAVLHKEPDTPSAWFFLVSGEDRPHSDGRWWAACMWKSQKGSGGKIHHGPCKRRKDR